MSLFVTKTLESNVGPIEIAITRVDHISAQGKPVVRDTSFHCHLHFYQKQDGTWAVRDEDRPSMSRAYVNGMSNAEYNKPAPPTYFAKVLAAYTDAINKFAAANAGLFTEAETRHLTREIASVESKLTDLRTQVSDKEKELRALQSRLSEVQGFKDLEVFPDL